MKKILLLIVLLTMVNISSSAKNTALIIGIGDYNYEETGWPAIHGNNDVQLLAERFLSKGFHVVTLKDASATKTNIMASLIDLVADASNDDIIYLHFSGHGQPVADMNEDEEDGLDQSFVCYDACFSTRYNFEDKPYMGQNHLIDDEIFPILNQLKARVGDKGQIIIAFDSCFSGGADRGDAIDDGPADGDVEFITYTRGSCDEFCANETSQEYLSNIVMPDDYAVGGGSVLVISACPRDKKNFECKEKESGICYGSLSYCISKMLDNNLPFDQWEEFFTSKKFREYQIFRFSQRPVVDIH